jgi:hypothetical protein
MAKGSEGPECDVDVAIREESCDNVRMIGELRLFFTQKGVEYDEEVQGERRNRCPLLPVKH